MHVYLAWMILSHQKKVKVCFKIKNDVQDENYNVPILKRDIFFI